jgi:DNA topoisomerase-1
MGKPLIIVESPTKTKTLKSFLGGRFEVEASMGHVRDLPEKEIGVDVEQGFKPKYVSIASRRSVISRLSAAAKSAEAVYLASDPDREGEAIAWHLAAALKLKSPKRVVFNELTRSAVEAAMENPREVLGDLVEAQEARRILDRLVGYRLSPLLWRKVRKGLSAGRVQSVAVRMVCDREREILGFVTEEYWSLTALVSPQEPQPHFPFEARLVAVPGMADAPDEAADEKAPAKEKRLLSNQADADAVVAAVREAAFVIRTVKRQERKRNAAAPFITSTLQQEASRKLGFSNRRTMSTAQELYEGIDVGDASVVGLITYMRTDSTRVANEAQEEARAFITAQYGAEYVPPKPPRHRKSAAAQDAHEAVRPTSVERTPDSLAGRLSPDQMKLYRLIWQRFLASQMNPAIFDVTTADIDANGYTFRATGSVRRFDGFMRIYTEGRDTDERTDEERDPLPPLEAGQPLDMEELSPRQHFTEPPPRYTEATLVRALEERRIGRPSTFASIISTIQDREYVQLEEKRFRPTELGFTVNDLLVKHFPQIMDVDFTAGMEAKLDEVEAGRADKVQVLTDFYGPFDAMISEAHETMERLRPVAVESEFDCPNCGQKMMIRTSDRGDFLGCSAYPRCKTVLNMDGTPIVAATRVVSEHRCPKCSKDMVERDSRFGKFLGCTGYPKCRGVLNLDGTERTAATSADAPDSGQACPKCGKPLLERSGRFGKFLGCSAYPTCKTIVKVPKDASAPKEAPAAAPAKLLGIPCPKDDGQIVEKKSRRGTMFYGCSNYPSCDFSTWNRPVGRPCTHCSWPLGEKSYRGKPTGAIVCSNPACGLEEGAEQAGVE